MVPAVKTDDAREADAGPDESYRVAVRRIDLTHFRSYRQARIECDARPAILVGANGAGKTNLLEALSFLAPGRGLRRARLSDVDHRPELLGSLDGEVRSPASAAAFAPWAVAVRVDTALGSRAVGTGRDDSGSGGDRRVVRIDGNPAKGQTDLAAHLSLVWVTPQMDRLFQDGAGQRRRFLDRLVFGFYPDHAQRLVAYEHALRERARLLADGSGDAIWLGRLEETMAREGIAVTAARCDVVRRIGAAIAAGASPHFPVPALAMAGHAERWLEEMPALAAEDRFRTELAQARRLDGETGGASIGPHRSDLDARDARRGVAAASCSTGEQKALLIGLVLAHARLLAADRGWTPILLLDEVAAHLDAGRRRALFEAILALGCQAWMTGTETSLFAELGGDAQFFTVSEGGAQPLPAAHRQNGSALKFRSAVGE